MQSEWQFTSTCEWHRGDMRWVTPVTALPPLIFTLAVKGTSSWYVIFSAVETTCCGLVLEREEVGGNQAMIEVVSVFSVLAEKKFIMMEGDLSIG